MEDTAISRDRDSVICTQCHTGGGDSLIMTRSSPPPPKSSCWPEAPLGARGGHHALGRVPPPFGMRMLYANLYHTGTRLQSNKVRIKSSSVTVPWAPFAVNYPDMNSC